MNEKTKDEAIAAIFASRARVLAAEAERAASPSSKSTKEADAWEDLRTAATVVVMRAEQVRKGRPMPPEIAALERALEELASSSIKEDGERQATIPLAGGWGNLTEGKDFERVKEDGKRAEPELRWCNHCGEGVTNFCRGKSEACPMQLKKLRLPPSPLGDTPDQPKD